MSPVLTVIAGASGRLARGGSVALHSTYRRLVARPHSQVGSSTASQARDELMYAFVSYERSGHLSPDKALLVAPDKAVFFQSQHV